MGSASDSTSISIWTLKETEENHENVATKLGVWFGVESSCSMNSMPQVYKDIAG